MYFSKIMRPSAVAIVGLVAAFGCGLAWYEAAARGADEEAAAKSLLPNDQKVEDIEDGIYIVKQAEGRRLKRSDGGGESILGERVSTAFGKVTIRSCANDNSSYWIGFKNAGPLPEAGHWGVVVSNICMPTYSNSQPRADGTFDLTSRIDGQATAQKIAARLNVDLQLRKHPGHRLQVSWSPDKDVYDLGETVTLKMTIRNEGPTTFSFLDGGQQRGARNNQFRFLAYRAFGKAVPDTGDPTNDGGTASLITMKPGESFSETVQLDRWFKFTEPDSYRVTGIFELQLLEPGELMSPPLWDELVAGDCVVRIRAKS